MANILVIAEITNNKVKSVTHEILSHLNGHSVSVLAMNDISEHCEKDLADHGCSNLTVLKNEALSDYSPRHMQKH